MLEYINKLGNWMLAQDGGHDYKDRIFEVRQQWVDAETLMESALHWAEKVGFGDKYEFSEGAPPFKAALEKIEEASANWRQLLDDMAIPYQGQSFPTEAS